MHVRQRRLTRPRNARRRLVWKAESLGSEANGQGPLAVETDLNDIRTKQESEGPVNHDAQPPAPSRHLQEIIAATYKPSQDAVDAHLEKLAKRLAMAQGTHHSHGVVDEGFRF